MLGNLFIGSSRPRRMLFPTIVMLLLFHASLAHAQAIIKVNDNVFFRIGAQLQFWADEQQDATTKGYVQNLFIRRGRLLVTGQVAPNVTFFFQTDNPNAGKVPKALGSGFLLQDFWAEWKINDYFALSGGEFLVPLSRQALTSTLSFLTLDISPTATVFSAPTQSNGLRDTGFQAKGYLADGRLEYRGAIFQGIRAGTPLGRNPFRRSAYLQYDFFEKERGYVYAGTNLGKKKVVAISFGYDGQSKYKAYSGNLFATMPVAKGDEVAGTLQRSHYDGGTFITAIAPQNDDLLELGYYLSAVKVQPFVKYEDQKFKTNFNPTRDQTRYGAGLNYYVAGQNLKFTGQIFHVKPKNGAINSTNEYSIQMQVWYY
jgi:hypothetical protein